MSGRGAGGGLGEFLRSFAQAFLKASQRSRGSGSGSGSRSGPKPTLRTHAPQVDRTVRSDRRDRFDGEESPGQFGAGATRDLSAAELRGLRPSYAPKPDGDPDPGEIVWTWVPYVENDGRGKDRPVLIIARLDGGFTAGCYLSTKHHDGFVSIGTGPWDSQGRESFVSPERVLRISDEGMRREGHVLDRDRFLRAVQAVLREQGLSGS